jgi:hypothetical protein
VTADTKDDPDFTWGIKNDLISIENEYILEKTGIRLPVEQGTFAPGDILFEQPPTPGTGAWAGVTSDAGAGYIVADGFNGLTADIGDVHWWGLSLIYPWAACDPTGMEFEIIFYDGQPPAGAVVDTFTVSPPAVPTGDNYAGFPVFKWEVDLPNTVSLVDGWMSIQGVGSPNGCWFLWANSQIGTFDGLQDAGAGWAPSGYNQAFSLTEGAAGPGPGDCIEDYCDFEVVSINNVDGPINSLPQFINITIANNGDIPIYEVKILVDIYEKVCLEPDSWCWPICKDIYNPKNESNNENFSVYDCPLDGVEDPPSGDDLGDTFTLWVDDFYDCDLSYRSTSGYLRYPGADDTYVGRSEQCLDDALIFHPAPVKVPVGDPKDEEFIFVHKNDIKDAHCAKFSFAHRTKGEYMLDDDGNVIPIDYGYISYRFVNKSWDYKTGDKGLGWITIPISDFVAYDNAWEKWDIYFVNTAANDGEYELICDSCLPDCDTENYIVIETEFPTDDTLLQFNFSWHVNPCNQYEGWFIDDICLEITPEFEYQLVHQTHDITSLPACPEEGYFRFHTFPLIFDPEPDTWYLIEVCGQVFPWDNITDGCEYNLSNNCLWTQFQVTDIHDIACISGCDDDVILHKKTMCCQEDEKGVFEFTFKNLGTFPETNVPVDLKVTKKIISYPLMETFETDPSGRWNTYYFTGSSPVDLWEWTEGYEGVPETRSAEDQPIGTESMLCALQDLRPELMQNMGNLLTNDEVYDLCDKDFCCEEFELHFSAKWAMPFGREYDLNGYTGCGISGYDRAYMLMHPTEGPDSEYWWLIGLGMNEGTYVADWVEFVIDRDQYMLWFGYTDCNGEVHCPPFEFGFAVFTNCDGNKVNPEARDKWGNAFPWGGLMVDNIFISSHDCVGSGDVVDTQYLSPEDPCDNDEFNCDPHEILEPGEEETITLYWNDTDYCNWCVIADVNLPTDVNPENDDCCVQALVISDCSCGADDTLGVPVDLTGGGDCNWGPCQTDTGDDTFMTASVDFGDYRAYLPNMDDSLIIDCLNLSEYSETGAILQFNTYFKFFSWCDPNYGTRYDDGTWLQECEGDFPTDIPADMEIFDTGDFGEVYAKACDNECCDYNPCDPCEAEWICLYSPTKVKGGTDPIGCRLWWDDYYFCDGGEGEHQVCVDGKPRLFDWATVEFNIPPELCQRNTSIRFRMVSNDLNTDCIPNCEGPDESEGWYIDDLKIFGTLKEYLIEEDFSSGQMPPEFNEIVYSGTGNWQIGSGSYYTPPPPASPPWAECDSDGNPTLVYDCELFTGSMDLSMGGNLDVLHAFEDYAGMGQATINTYSGGYGPGFYEETLIYMDLDGDDGTTGGGAPFSASLVTSGYSDPTDVYLGFWYTTDGGTYAWNYAFDNLEVYTFIPGPIAYTEDFEDLVYPNKHMFCERSESGNYWTYTDVIPPDWLGLIDPDCDDHQENQPCHSTDEFFWLLKGYPEFDIGLNNALDIPIFFAEDWTQAWFSAYHSALICPGEAAYIELSTDGGATWTNMWQWENYYREYLDDTAHPHTFELCLQDLDGNGWNGSTIDVWVFDHLLGGWLLIAEDLTVNAGEDIVCIEFEAWAEDIIEIDYKPAAGTNDQENNKYWLREDGVIIQHTRCGDHPTNFDFFYVVPHYLNPDRGCYFWQCMEKRIDLTPYIEAGLDSVIVRFRWTTRGNEDCCHSEYPAWGGWAVDNLEIQCKKAVFTDDVPPVTQIVFDPSSGEVSLFANDPGMPSSGVAATYYILDGGATQTYTGTIQLSEGCHDIKYWSEDVAGNVESQKSKSNMCVDTTPPTIEITEPLEGLYVFGSRVLQTRILGSGALCIGSVTIKADASDDSGVTLVTFEINGDTGYDVSAPYEYKYMGMHFGSATVTATAYDANGLTAEDTATFTIYSLGLL